jgi:hypothetical protein
MAWAGAVKMLARMVMAVPTAEETLEVEMKLAAWTAAVEKLLGEMVVAQEGWRYERQEGDGYMAMLTAAWKAALRAMIGCRMAATGEAWSHPPPPEVILLRIGAFLCV